MLLKIASETSVRTAASTNAIEGPLDPDPTEQTPLRRCFDVGHTCRQRNRPIYLPESEYCVQCWCEKFCSERRGTGARRYSTIAWEAGRLRRSRCKKKNVGTISSISTANIR